MEEARVYTADRPGSTPIEIHFVLRAGRLVEYTVCLQAGVRLLIGLTRIVLCFFFLLLD